jgi:S1-C subfamily serine protease
MSATYRNVDTGQTSNTSGDKIYRIAIVKDSSRDNFQFVAVVLESIRPNWKAGRVKAHFRKTSYATVYEGLWYMVDYAEKKGNYIMDKNGIIENNASGFDPRPQYRSIQYNLKNLFIKAYPPINYKVAAQTDFNPTTTGSGFILASSGLIVTNYHVVKDSKRIKIVFPEKNLTLKSHVKIKDEKNDIAILGLDNATADSLIKKQIPFIIGDTKRVKVGQRVFTLGFPLGEIMGSISRASAGNINSLYGIQDDPRLFQISTPLQPGNSGGPLFNQTGEVIGIVVSSLNAKFLYENAGIIPQNVNFALKSDYLKNLISMLPDAEEILYRKSYIKQGPIEVLVEQLSPYIVQIKTY